MSEPGPATYSGRCHCGTIRYTVKLENALAPGGSGKINRCNCSICTKNGYLLIYPLREDVKFVDGCDVKLKDYYFGKKNKPHRFCSECGSSILIDFKNSDIEAQRLELALNARMLDDIDLDRVEFTTFDGRNKLGPPYSA